MRSGGAPSNSLYAEGPARRGRSSRIQSAILTQDDESTVRTCAGELQWCRVPSQAVPERHRHVRIVGRGAELKELVARRYSGEARRLDIDHRVGAGDQDGRHLGSWARLDGEGWASARTRASSAPPPAKVLTAKVPVLPGDRVEPIGGMARDSIGSRCVDDLDRPLHHLDFDGPLTLGTPPRDAGPPSGLHDDVSRARDTADELNEILLAATGRRRAGAGDRPSPCEDGGIPRRCRHRREGGIDRAAEWRVVGRSSKPRVGCAR